MLNIFQKTVNKPVSFEGIGLHTGKTSTVKILPSAENQGIIFKRVDLKENNLIDAKYTNVTSSNLCTTLENKFQVTNFLKSKMGSQFELDKEHTYFSHLTGFDGFYCARLIKKCE